MSPILVLLAAGALAGSPSSADVPYAGLPLDVVPSLGLGDATLSRDLDEVRIALPAGGVAVLEIAGSEAEADVVFERRLHTAAGYWPPAAVPLAFERSAGDGVAVVVVRQRNAVLYVRDLGNDAATVASTVLAALTTDTSRCAPVTRTDPDGTRWSACGARIR